MPHQITPYDCPGPPDPTQAMNIDRFARLDAQVDLVQDPHHVAFRGHRQILNRKLVERYQNFHLRRALGTLGFGLWGRSSVYKLPISYFFWLAIWRPRATDRLIAACESPSFLLSHA